MSQPYFRVLFWLVLSVVLLGSLLPSKVSALAIFSYDKFMHSSAFALLYFFAERAYCTVFSGLILGFVVVGFGLAIEIAQNFILYRHADSFDIIANACGVLLAASIINLHKFYEKTQESSDDVMR